MNRRLRLALPSFSPFLFLLALFGAVSPAAAGWRLVSSADTYGSVTLPPSPVGTLFVSGDDSIYRSTDFGATFSRFAVPVESCPVSGTPIVAPDPSQAGTLYASDRKNLWKSVDNGASWQPATSPGIGWITDLTVLPDAPGHLLAVADADIWLAAFPPPPPCYPTLAGSGVALSRDGGQTWSVIHPMGSSHYEVATFDPAHVERLYLGTAAGDLFLTKDGGASFKTLDFPVHFKGMEDLRIDPTPAPGTLFARAGGQYYRAPLLADGSVGPWTTLTQAPHNQFPPIVHRNLVLDPYQPGTLYTFTNRGVYTSTDRGDTWTDITGGDIPLNSMMALALDPRPGGPLYAASRQGLYVLDRSSCSENGGGTCLNNFRFKVSATFRIPGGPITPAHVQTLSADTADFWFFSPGNVELIVKVLDGRAVNGDFWVFAGGLSDVEYTVTVADTATGTLRSYTKGAGKLESFADTSYPAAQNPGKGADLPLAIDPFLLPDAAPGCAAGSTTLCLADSRFQVSVTYEAGPFAGSGRTLPLTGDTGAFWFLSPDNIELVVKVLDGRGLNGRFWVFYGALSDVAYTVTVTDTVTGAVRTYTNPQGRLASFADTNAF